MNGCRTLFAKQDFEKVKNLDWGLKSVRVGCYDVVIDNVEFISAIEVLKEQAPTDAEIEVLEEEALKQTKAGRVEEIREAASSDSVKKFQWLGEETCWWDSEQRASIRASLEARPDGELCYLEVNGQIYEMSKERALAILDKIEVYASDCHLTVCVAINEIGELQTVAEVRAYEIEWPEVVVITEADIDDETEEAES